MNIYTACVFFLITNLFLTTNIQSQEFDIREFKADPNDLSARVYELRTANDEPAALIKITTNIKGMQFDSNIGIVDVEHKDDGYWVYVAPRERRIRIMATDYLAQDISLPEPARSLTVYHLVIASRGAVASSDLVRVTFRLNQNNVYIRSGQGAPVLSNTTNAVFNVPRGEHTFRFIKQGFAEKEQTINLTEDQVIAITLEPGQVTTSFALSGMVLVTSEPSGAEVFLNDQRAGVTPYQGSQIAGNYTLLLRHPSYHDHYEQFILKEGETNTLTNIRLKPRYGYWEITTNPSGATVHLNGRLVGTTPLARGQILSGQHELMLRKRLYHQHTESFSIDDGNEKKLDITLKPAFGKLVITSDPPGASVLIDGREAGTTPYSNPRQPSGDYNITLKKELHADVHDNFRITDNETTERFLALTMNYGTVEIQTDDAEIFINEQRIGRGNRTQNLAPGNYRIRATKENHEDDEKDVFVMLGQTQRVSLAPQPRMGSVRIISEPFETAGAEIYINGLKQPQTTPAVIPLLFGEYDVTIKKAGFIDVKRRISIREEQEADLNTTMQKGMQVTILSTPPGADLYINERLVGKTPYTVVIGYGKHNIELINSSIIKKDEIDVSHGGKTRWTYDVSENQGTFTDSRDGNVYKWVKIGEQVWMAENLAYQPQATGRVNRFLSSGSNHMKYFFPDGDENNVRNYGCLYNYNIAQTVCPAGWRLPDLEQWKTLTTFLSGSGITGNWQIGSGVSDHGLNFHVAAGWRTQIGAHEERFEFLNRNSFYWLEYGEKGGYVSSKFTNDRLRKLNSVIYSHHYDGNLSISVRCIKD